MGADKRNPALSRRAGQRSSRHERKRLGEAVILFLLGNWTCPRNVRIVLTLKHTHIYFEVYVLVFYVRTGRI